MQIIAAMTDPIVVAAIIAVWYKLLKFSKIKNKII